MAILMNNLDDAGFNEAFMGVLQEFCNEGIVLVRAEKVDDLQNGTRKLILYYSRVSEGLVARQRRQEAPRYPIEISMPLSNTHLDTDKILAKLALVR